MAHTVIQFDFNEDQTIALRSLQVEPDETGVRVSVVGGGPNMHVSVEPILFNGLPHMRVVIGDCVMLMNPDGALE